MKILLNNSDENFDREAITITELLKEKNYTFKMLVVKINDKIIKKEDYNTSTIKDGDNVIILHLMSGG